MIHKNDLNLHSIKVSNIECIPIFNKKNDLIARNIKFNYMIPLAYGEIQNCHIVSYYK